MVLRVSPESLGPITVTAHISGSAITVELASGTAAGHDAVRAVLADLRRDLAVLAPFSSVTLAPAGGEAAAGPAAAQHPMAPTSTSHTAAGASGPAASGMSQTPDDPRGDGHPRALDPPAEASARTSDAPDAAGHALPVPPPPLGAGRIDLYA